MDVPFREKDKAKRFGCRWNPEGKHWYYETDLANVQNHPECAVPYDWVFKELQCDDMEQDELDAMCKKANKRHLKHVHEKLKTDESLFGKKTEVKITKKKVNKTWDTLVFDV